MYNYWRSERASQTQTKIDKVKKDEEGRAPTRRGNASDFLSFETYLLDLITEKQERLVHNYKKRVENFVMQMLEKPIKYGEFRAQETHRFRDEDPTKFKGGPTILVKSFKTEADRIRENIEKNKEFETDHVEFAIHQFRERDPSREIQPQMHFSTKSGLDRIASKLGSMKASLDSDNKRFDRDDSFLLELSKSPVTATNKYIAKHFMAELHQKTHFNAATSLYLALPDGLVDNNLPSMRLKRKNEKGLQPIERKPAKAMGGDDESPVGLKLPMRLKGLEGRDPGKDSIAFEPPEIEDMQKVAEKNYNNIENINPVEISKKILLDCHFIRPKPQGVRTLHPGEGHLSMLPLKSVREIYTDVYHKDFSSHRK